MQRRLGMILVSDDCVGTVWNLPAKVIVWTTLTVVNAVAMPMPEVRVEESAEEPADNQSIASQK